MQAADLLVAMPAEPKQRPKAALAHNVDDACLQYAGALEQRAQTACERIWSFAWIRVHRT